MGANELVHKNCVKVSGMLQYFVRISVWLCVFFFMYSLCICITGGAKELVHNNYVEVSGILEHTEEIGIWLLMFYHIYSLCIYSTVGAKELVHKNRVEVDGMLEDSALTLVFSVVYECGPPAADKVKYSAGIHERA